MTIENTELKEMVGKRITIDGERHRVAKVSVRAGTLTTVAGATVETDGIYKRGRGYFFDTPKKGKKTPKVADEAPKETARQRRQREKEEAEAATTGKSNRGRNRGGKKADEEVETPRERRRREKAEAAADTKTKTKAPAKKKLVKAFDQAIAERVTQEVQDAIARVLAEHGTYAVVPIAAGATFTEKDVKVTITLMSSEASSKEIDAYIREHRNSTDIAPEDEEEDELDELEDDDSEDEEDEQEEDEDLEDDEDEDEEDEDEDEDEEDEEVEDDSPSIDDLVASIVEDYPNLKADKVRGFVEAYLTSDAIEDKLGDELMPGVTRLHKKGSELELLLVGFDEDEETVKLVNTETGKFRSVSIDDVVRMEIVEEEEDDE